MRSISPIERRPGRLALVAAVVWLGSARAIVAAEASEWLTGPALERKLETSETISWSGNPLREALAELAAVHRIAILLDRRIDPGQPLELSFQQTPLGAVLESVAADRGLGLSRFGAVAVFGPREAMRRLRTVAELRRQDLAQLTPAARGKWVRVRPWQWDALSTPRGLLEQVADDGGFRIQNLEIIPHDLWGAGDLPPLSISDRLTLVLGQFDLTFELVSPQGDLRLVAIPAEVAIERSYPAGRQAQERADELRKRLPEARIRVEGTKIILRGLVEEHELVDDRAAQKARPASANGQNLEKIELTLTVKQIPLVEVLKKLEQQLDLELKIDTAGIKAANRSLEERISFELKGASLDATLRAALTPAGLTFRRTGKQVEILPGETP
jgi:hypothetical protein